MMVDPAQVGVVIVAAGRGTRVGGTLPKQWRSLGRRTVLAQTLRTFRKARAVGRIVLVLHPDDAGMGAGYAAHPDVTVAMGGADRPASVLAGLEALATLDPPQIVLIHDVARPLVDDALIGRVIAALLAPGAADGAAPALAVTDALWTGADSRVTGTRDRAGLYRAQTPQGFRFAAILAAHRVAAATGGDPADDDVAVARAAGLDVAIVAGDERNLKITTESDFAIAEGWLALRASGFGSTAAGADREEAWMDVRCGNGFDVHAFADRPASAVTLCGIAVPHDRALLGHSDADVGLHALTDAIYGALAEGDIGQHFPPSDQRWRGADSALFLEHAMERVVLRGFVVANMDTTLICERPKIGPHVPRMRANLARITAVAPDRISVKATTTERLGFAGRGEGIAAMATVMLVAP